MNNDKTYNDALGWARRLYKELLEIKRKTDAFVELNGLLERLEKGFPELKESEDEWIINHIIEILNRLAPCHWDGNEKARCIAYLEKLKEFQFGYPGIYFYDGEKLHFQGNPVMEEKQKEQNPAEWSDAERKQLYSDGFNTARKALAGVFMQYLDEHRPEGKMCLSNGECAQLDNAFKVGDVETIVRYINKYQQPEERLKAIHPHPHWKPSEDEERLIKTSISFLKDFADKGYENAVECINWLKSKLNGNTCE